MLGKLILGGIYHSPSFEEDLLPDLVISSTYRTTAPMNYAVCYGIRILKPEYIHDIVMRLGTCWKRVADSQDSFTWPEVEDEQYRPRLDGSLPMTRNSETIWLPDPKRKRLFAGWRILGLRSKQVSPEIDTMCAWADL